MKYAANYKPKAPKKKGKPKARPMTKPPRGKKKC